MLDFYTFKHFSKHLSLMHLVSTKSLECTYAFSLALHTGEDETDILKNRNTLAKQIQTNTPLNFVVANQTHGSRVVVIKTPRSRGWENQNTAINNCDALITNLPNIMLGILTADCVSILLYDAKQGVVASIHAGWRGTQKKIVTKTLQKMKTEFKSNPENILAAIAPSIGKCCYEVDKNVARHFFSSPNSFTRMNEKYMLDLPYLNKEQLLSFGVNEKNIEMSNICTSCQTNRFFSYRKEKGCSGRFISMIGLKDMHES